MTVDVVILQDTDRRALDIVVLTAAQRPEEGGKPGEAEQQGHGDQIDEHVHGEHRRGVSVPLTVAATRRPSSLRRRARNALSVTRIEEPDMATAAINGVTQPAT